MFMLIRRSVLPRAVLLAVIALAGQDSGAVALPATPVGTFSHPGDGSPTAVAVAGQHAYLTHACGSTCYGPLDVIDVSNPARPALLGATPLSWGTAGIAVQGSYAYTTGYSANPNYLRMIDVSRPAAPFTAAAFTQVGLHPQAVAVQGPYAYMVDYGTDRLEVVDVADPSAGAFDAGQNTSPLSLPLRGGVATGAGPSGVAAQGNHAYVVNAVSGTVEAIDVADPARPVVAGRVSLGHGGTRGTSYPGIAVRGAYAYVADADANALRVVDVADPTRPSLVATAPAGQNPTAIAIQDDRAFVTNKASNTLQVFDISTPAKPASLGTIATDAGPTAVAAGGRHVYVANAAGASLQIFDLDGAGPAPVASGSFSLPSASALTITKAYALRLPVRCSGAGRCTGRATLTATTLKHGSAATIGSARFSLAGGTTRTLTIHLSRTGRARLHATTARLRARLTLTGTAGGRRLSQSKAIRLTRPPR
jgi:hypothetical protein